MRRRSCLNIKERPSVRVPCVLRCIDAPICECNAGFTLWTNLAGHLCNREIGGQTQACGEDQWTHDALLPSQYHFPRMHWGCQPNWPRSWQECGGNVAGPNRGNTVVFSAQVSLCDVRANAIEHGDLDAHGALRRSSRPRLVKICAWDMPQSARAASLRTSGRSPRRRARCGSPRRYRQRSRAAPPRFQGFRKPQQGWACWTTRAPIPSHRCRGSRGRR